MPRELLDLLRACARSPVFALTALALFLAAAAFITVGPTSTGIYLKPGSR